MNKIKDIDTDTRLLLERLKSGDHEAYQQIYFRWNKSVMALLIKLLPTPADADDLTQDVFVKLWENRHKIDTTKNIRSFIYLIARQAAYNFFDKAKVRKNYLANISLNDEDSVTSYDVITAKELEGQIGAIVNKMPEQRRAIYNLHFQEDLTNQQISERLNIESDKVARELYRAKKQLRDLLPLFIALLLP